MKSYLKTLSKLISAEVAAKVILGAISIVCVAFMEPNEFAKYAFAVSIFILLSSLIGSVFNIIYIVNVDIDKYHSSLLLFQLLIVVFFLCIFLNFRYLFSGLLLHTIILVAAQCIFLFNQTARQKKLQFRSYYLAEYIRAGFFAAFVTVIYFRYEFSASNLLIAQIGATALAIMPSIKMRTISNNLDNFFAFKELVSIVVISKMHILALYFITIAILLNVDMLIIKTFGESEDVANYGAAFRYYSILQVALIAAQKLLLPTVAQSEKISEVKTVFSQHKKISLYLIVLALPLYLFAVYVIPLIDGGKYPDSVQIFLILAVSAYLSFSFSPYSNVLIKFKRYLFMFVLALIALLIHIPLSYYLFSYQGSFGVALSNLLVYGVVNYAIYIRSKNLIRHTT